MMGTWGVSFVVLIVLRFWISRQFFEGVPLPLWASLLVILGIAAVLFYYRSKSAIRYLDSSLCANGAQRL